MRHAFAVVVIGGLALVVASCGQHASADIHLSVDPNLNSEAEVLAKIAKVVIVVDSDAGLYPPGSERAVGDVQIKNADSDPALELLITVPVPSHHLPFIRLERGSLPSVPLKLRVFGLSADPNDTTYLGRGEISNVVLADPTTTVNVPFNLRPEQRAPRVEEVLPADGAEATDCKVNPIVVLFSRPMDRESLETPGTITITPDPGPLSVFVDDSGLVANIAAPGLLGDGSTLIYHLEVANAATDRSGDPLDQTASDPGLQAFEADFTLTCVIGPLVPMPPICVEGLTCGMTYDCIDSACQPKDCLAECAAGEVCDPERSVCVRDCRVTDAFNVCLATETCDASGFCR